MSSIDAERPFEPSVPVVSSFETTEVVQSGANFYHEGSDAEAERLRMMARIADGVSINTIRQLRPMLDSSAPVVVDIGAGDSLSLGSSLREAGYTYIPVDTRNEVVEAHRSAGFDAVQAMATKLPMKNNTVDALHSRFTWGWLGSEERSMALAEMLRVGRDKMALTVIDYDWSTVRGPKIFVDIVEKVKDIMRETGFDPDYGAKAADDINAKLGQLVSGEHSVSEKRTETYIGTIDKAYDIINQTARAIIDQLNLIDMRDKAAELSSDLAVLQAYIAQHPDEKATLPDIVATSVAIDEKSSKYTNVMATYLSSYDGLEATVEKPEPFIEGRDFVQALPDVEALSKVAVAVSPSMIHAARVIQTVAYIKDGIVGFSAVGRDGALSEEIDPQELVNRSIYFTSMRPDGKIGGMIRIIRPDSQVGIRSLPTIDRLYRHSPKAWQWLLDSPVMERPEEVMEVSGLAKNMLGGSFQDTVLAMLVMSEFAIQNGYRYGIMGLQKSKLGAIEGVFGTQAIQHIQGEDAEHPVDLPGVSESIRFAPLYVDGYQFAQLVYDNAKNRHGELFKTLANAAKNVIDSRSA